MIKQAAIEAVNQSSPMTATYGTVTKIDPLEINVEQRLPIPSEALILTSRVIDREIEISINGGTRNSAILFDALKVGEEVTLLRVQGGQKYIVLDRSVI